jgi:flagella basal body P-ring formation protein FlgA
MKRLVLLALILFAAPAVAQTGVRIVVPAHDIGRGDTIADSDLTFAMVDGSALSAGVVTSMNVLTGMQTRRVLRAGEILRADDVRRPVIVAKGQTVTMVFSMPGVELTAMGRAMGEGGLGDTVTVQNPASYRMITATVSGPGTVRAIGGLAQPALTARR